MLNLSHAADPPASLLACPADKGRRRECTSPLRDGAPRLSSRSNNDAANPTIKVVRPVLKLHQQLQSSNRTDHNGRRQKLSIARGNGCNIGTAPPRLTRRTPPAPDTSCLSSPMTDLEDGRDVGRSRHAPMIDEHRRATLSERCRDTEEKPGDDDELINGRKHRD